MSAAQARSGNGAYLGWASGDGSVLVGSLGLNGTTRPGIFRGGKFTALPALPPAGLMSGSIAW